MTDARCPRITIYVESKDKAEIGGRPGPRVAKGVAIDGQEYYVPQDSDISISCGPEDAIQVTVTFLANDVAFEELARS